MQAGDIDQLLSTFGDVHVLAAFDSEPFDRTQVERWVRRNLAHQEQVGYGLFSAVLKASGLVIGDCGLEHRRDSSSQYAGYVSALRSPPGQLTW